MTNLSNRVTKAKQLRFTSTQQKGIYNTWGSNDDHYIITLTSDEKEIVTPDGYLTVKVFRTKCERQNYSLDFKKYTCVACRGNTAHTVCYHALGAIYNAFQETNQQVSFYNSYRDADRALTFGGYLAKVVNQNGRGFVWCRVYKKDNKSEKQYIMELPKEVLIDKN